MNALEKNRILEINHAWIATLIVSIGWIFAFGTTYVDFATNQWTLDQNAHAPFVMAIILGATVARLSSEKFGRPGKIEEAVGGFVLLCGLLLLVLGRVGEITFLMSGAQGVTAAGLTVLFFGAAGLKRFWFPLLMFVYLLIWPGWAIDALTFPLKLMVSGVVGDWLFWAGLPVAHAGTVITAGPYQLLIADACAGLNSLIALTAVGAVYLYIIKRPSIVSNLIVLMMLIPIAIFANIVRVGLLVLITYYFGYDAGQSFIHEGAGLLMFLIALTSIFIIDALLAFATVKVVR